MTPPLVIERPKLRLWKGEPITILGDAKKAAIKAGVSLLWWEEFSKTAWACLTADCEPEELEAFLRVVEERFEVTKSEGFTLHLPTKAKDE